MTKLSAASSRAGRALLKWSVRDLAREAEVSPTTVNQIELDQPFKAETAVKISAAFERAGVELLNSDAPGARLKPS